MNYNRCTQLTGCYGEQHDMRCPAWTTPVDVPSPKDQASNLRKAADNDPGGPFSIDMIWAASTIEGLLAERDEARALLAHKSECLTRAERQRDALAEAIDRALQWYPTVCPIETVTYSLDQLRRRRDEAIQDKLREDADYPFQVRRPSRDPQAR